MPNPIRENIKGLLHGQSLEQVLGRLFEEADAARGLSRCSKCKKRPALGYALCESCRTYNRERREGLKKAGVCINCKGTLSESEGIWCRGCLDKRKAQRELRKDSGHCTRCESIAIPGQTLCETCKAFDKHRIKTLKDEGFCVRCYIKKACDNKTVCESCSQENACNAKKWRDTQKLLAETPLGQLEKEWLKDSTDWESINRYYRELQKLPNLSTIKGLLTESFSLVEDADHGLSDFLRVFSFVAAPDSGDAKKVFTCERPVRRDTYVERLRVFPDHTPLATKTTPAREATTGRDDFPHALVESVFVLFKAPSGFALNVSYVKGYKDKQDKIRRYDIEANAARYVTIEGLLP